MYHYVYKLENTETSEYYIGSRTSELHPSLDKYLGSMKTWKVDRKLLKKIILRDDFSKREDAIQFEREMIERSIEDPLNRNYNIPGANFHTHGMISVINEEGKTQLIDKKDPRYLNGELKFMWVGKKHTDIAKVKMSKSAKERNIDKETEKRRREKISSKMKGVKKPEEFAQNLSESRKGENNPFAKWLKENPNPHKGRKFEKIECQYCKRMISKSIIHIKHQENCKSKNK